MGGPARSSCRSPEDLLDQPAPDDARVDAGRPGPARPADDDVRAVIELLASAERPVILAGGGILRARTSTELLRFAELLQVPVIAAWRRGDVISNDHPLYLGMAGFGAAASVRERLATADAMLVIGCRLNEPTSYDDTIPAAATRWAHVDLEPARADGLRPADADRGGRRPGLPARRQRAARSARPCSMPSWSRARQANNVGRPRRLGGRHASSTPTPMPGPARASIPGASSRRCAACCPTTRSSPPTPATSPAGPVAASGSASPARSSDRRRGRWATACRPRSPRRSSIATVRSSRSSATAAWR